MIRPTLAGKKRLEAVTVVLHLLYLLGWAANRMRAVTRARRSIEWHSMISTVIPQDRRGVEIEQSVPRVFIPLRCCETVEPVAVRSVTAIDQCLPGEGVEHFASLPVEMISPVTSGALPLKVRQVLLTVRPARSLQKGEARCRKLRTMLVRYFLCQGRHECSQLVSRIRQEILVSYSHYIMAPRA